ncbi:hypothetical protein BDY19DRAFT_928519 [Irpex rosettiformis]|uniref:Uncharacterized protein n=1 Tax=Irpex rosettiformis TaxID=378272 RepID=A0ACB8UD22_9APHY|nr:hypothetical protein BDY19DRAFT_928519 [Irpex rosettiformis]
MATPQPNFRVIVRLPYNRPEESRPDPPRVEWNSEKEHILWEVIAKSRVVEGAGTDWKGLANHLQVPLPYLLYRAQARYEEDLRGLQGIQTLSPAVMSPTSPAGPSHGGPGPAVTSAQAFSPPPVEYFPRSASADKPGVARRDSLKFAGGVATSARPLAIRTRLNSLTARSLSSPLRATASSVATLQGTKRQYQHFPHHTLTPTSSRITHASDDADSSDEDEELRRAEEEGKRAEEQAALERKLKDLALRLTKDQLGLISSPTKDKGKRRDTDRGRIRPLSMSSTSASLHQQLHMSRRHSLSQTPSHHSLSSTTGSPQGSIPSIPSPPPESRSQPQSPSPMRHFSPAGKSTSPPVVAYNNALATRHQTMRRARTSDRVRSDIGSEMGSTASSFSDFSGTRYCPHYTSSELIPVRQMLAFLGWTLVRVLLIPGEDHEYPLIMQETTLVGDDGNAVDDNALGL